MSLFLLFLSLSLFLSGLDGLSHPPYLNTGMAGIKPERVGGRGRSEAGGNKSIFLLSLLQKKKVFFLLLLLRVPKNMHEPGFILFSLRDKNIKCLKKSILKHPCTIFFSIKDLLDGCWKEGEGGSLGFEILMRLSQRGPPISFLFLLFLLLLLLPSLSHHIFFSYFHIPSSSSFLYQNSPSALLFTLEMSYDDDGKCGERTSARRNMTTLQYIILKKTKKRS